MTKLLNKPLKTFIAFTCFVLAGSIPAYFYLVESIWIDELDDHNQLIKEQIQSRFVETRGADLDGKIALWNEIQSTSQIVSSTITRKDSVYFIERETPDHGVMELERFRGLSSTMILDGKFYYVTVETNVEEVHETVFAISVVTCLFILLLISGFVLLNRRLSKKIWIPFTDTLVKLKQFDLNSVSTIEFTKTDIAEFEELNSTLTRLIENNIQVYNQQREFTQNASHELQTPLAILKTKIDLLIQDPVLTAEQRKLIESLDNSVSRITRINKNLLLLAGIENKEYKSEEVHLSKIVDSLSESFFDFAEDKGCSISTSVKENVRIKANESLTEVLVSNILSNAVRHCTVKSGISVFLNDRSLIVSNEGETTLKQDDLFKRFISVSSENPGTGLGLAIVKEICDKYRWQVTYAYEGNQHIFSVSF